jgi:hemerythrin-like domain-containing protein
MLHDHHLGEDEFVFPYFQERLLDAPFDVLIAHHHEMESLLEDIQAACDTLAGNGQGAEASQALHGVLTRLSALWQPHIQLEEAQLTREALDTLWDAQEEAQFGKAISEYMQQLVDPLEMQECQAILSGAG